MGWSQCGYGAGGEERAGPIWVGPHVGGGGGPYLIALVQKVHTDLTKGHIVSHCHSSGFGQSDYTARTYRLDVLVALVLQ